MKEKVILITGGGRGIGRAAAERFAKAGGKVAFCARTEGEVIGTAKEIEAAGGVAYPFRVDISSRREVQKMVGEIMAAWGKIDVLINNASVLGSGEPIAVTPVESWEEVIRINVNGTFLVTQAVIRTMIPRRTGLILSVTSSVGRKGRAGWGAYAVSKFALEGMMQTLAEELAPFGITVITLNPGATRTKMRRRAYPKEDPSSLQDPSAVAQALLDLAEAGSTTLHGRSIDLSDLPLLE